MLSESVAAHLEARLAWPIASGLSEGYRSCEGALREVVESSLFTLRAAGHNDSKWWIHAAADMTRGSVFRQMFTQDWQRHYDFARLMEQVKAGHLEPEEFQQRLHDLPRPTPFPWLEINAIVPDAVVEASRVHSTRRSELVWPEWACLPVMEVGDVSDAPVAVVDALREIDQSVLDDATLEAVLEVSGGNPIEILADDVEYTPAARRLIDERARQAFALASMVLSPAPRPVFDLGRPQRWLRGDVPRWKATLGDDVVALHQLSWAERRWSCIGIALANAVLPEPAAREFGAPEQRSLPEPRVLVCDEPERGLHRRAEQHLSSALHQAALAVGAPVIVATHSPALLNDPRVTVVHVSRDVSTGRAMTSTLTPSTRSALDRELLAAELGLTPADLLQMTRVFVLVEGPHDRIVVEHLLGDDLDAAYATCIPVGGAKALTTLLDSDLLFSFTDAHVVLVLDNLNQAVIGEIWVRITAAYTAGDDQAAKRALRDLERIPGGEAGWLRNLAEQALTNGMLDRIHVHGLHEPDVICYLPPEFFVEGASSWEPLVADWRRHFAPRPPVDLKAWLRENRRGRISKKTIEAATRALQQTGRALSDDLVSLGLRTRELAAWGRPSQRPD